MQRAMMQLRRRRNASIALPINRLPPELLRMIFGHLRNLPSTRRFVYPDSVRFSSYGPLISAVLVCHKWFTIASQAASLWTDIHSSATEALLPRSLGAPIRLAGRVSAEDNRLEGIIKDNGARTCELDLWSVGPTVLVLQSILAVNMPRLRAISLFSNDAPAERLHSLLFTDVPASFPALKALMLGNVFFVPSQALPQLTHLYLGRMRGVGISNILDLLRNTPALEVLDIAPCRTLITPPPLAPSSVGLPRLHNVYIRSLPSICVHHLMRPLEVPALTFLHLAPISASPGAFASTPLVPRALATWTVNRLAVGTKPVLTDAAFRGNDVSLDVEFTVSSLAHEEMWTWLRHDLPTLLLLSAVEELHFQAVRWDVPARENLLAHLAPYMPAVSTLIVKHDVLRDSEDADGATRLAQTVAELLQEGGDSSRLDSGGRGPVLFPNLAHLGLIASDIPLALCEHLAPVLELRERDGRRLRKLRIRVDGGHSFRWKMKWLHEQKPDYAGTGVFDHVDEGEIYPKSRGYMSYEDYSYRNDDAWRVGWGEWKGCVKRAQHEFWESEE